MQRKLLGLLPEKLRLKLIRTQIQVSQEWPSPLFEIKIARSKEELRAAYGLLHDNYVRAGYMDPHPSGMRILPQHLLPQNTTIVAKWGNRVVGTVSLIRDNPLGLPMEKIFDLSARRAGGRRLAEVSSLAIDPNFRGKIGNTLFPIFRFAYQYSQNFFGTHEVVCAVGPEKVDFYRAVLCFEKLERAVKAYDFVNGARAVGLHFNFAIKEEELKRRFAHLPREANFYRYWTEVPKDPRHRLPNREFNSVGDPILTPELLEEFFMETAQFKNALTLFELQTLLNAYPYHGTKGIINSALNSRNRNHVRIDVQMAAQIAGDVGSDSIRIKGAIVEPIAAVEQNRFAVNTRRERWGRLQRDGLRSLQRLSRAAKRRLQIAIAGYANRHGVLARGVCTFVHHRSVECGEVGENRQPPIVGA